MRLLEFEVESVEVKIEIEVEVEVEVLVLPQLRRCEGCRPPAAGGVHVHDPS